MTSPTVDEIHCNRREVQTEYTSHAFFSHAVARMNMCILVAWLKIVSACAPQSYHPCLHVSVCPRCLVVVLPLCLSLIFDHLRDIHFPADFAGSGDSCVDHTRYMALWPYPHFLHNPDFQPRKHPVKKDMVMPGNQTNGLPAELTIPQLQLLCGLAGTLHGWHQSI